MEPFALAQLADGTRSPSVHPISPAAKSASSALTPYHSSNNSLLSIIRQEPARGNSERVYREGESNEPHNEVRDACVQGLEGSPSGARPGVPGVSPVSTAQNRRAPGVAQTLGAL